MPRLTERHALPELDDPRLRLLEAGARLLADDGFTVLEAGVSADRVTRMAGRTRRTFYDHFPAKSDFVREIIGRYLDLSDHEVINEAIGAMFRSVLDSSEGDIISAVTDISNLNFESQVGSQTTVLQMVGWALGRSDPGVRADLNSHYAAVDAAYASAFDSLLSAWNRKLRPPWTVESTAAMLRGLADGLYLRCDLDPSFDHGLFATCVLTFFGTATQPVDEKAETVDVYLRALSDEASLRWHERTEPAQIANARERVMDALVVELERRGYNQTRIDHIAATSGVSQHTISAAFGDLDDLVIAAIEDAVPAFDQEVYFDLGTPELQPGQVIERHIRRVAVFCRDHRALVRAVVTATFANNDISQGVRNFRKKIYEPLLAGLRHGQALGALDDDAEPDEIASFVTQSIVVSAAGPGPFDPEHTATTLTSILIRGLAPS